jgi:hypothetical protein
MEAGYVAIFKSCFYKLAVDIGRLGDYLEAHYKTVNDKPRVK